MTQTPRETNDPDGDRLRAAEALRSQGRSVTQVCEELGISRSTYTRWRRRHGRPAQDGTDGSLPRGRPGESSHPLEVAARRAFRGTRFYADLYGREPADSREIPFLTASDYHRAAGLLDCVFHREAILGVLPPYSRDASRFPFAVPEDELELVLRQRRIVRALEHLGVDLQAAPRFLIVADPRRGPFACELAKGLYWEGFQTSIHFAHDPAEPLVQEVARHDPDHIVLVSGRSQRHTLDRSPHTVWLVEQCGEGRLDPGEFPALLYADGIDLIGARAGGQGGYDTDPDQLLLEVDARSGLTHVTKLQASCFPLVRFGLNCRVPTAEGGS